MLLISGLTVVYVSHRKLDHRQRLLTLLTNNYNSTMMVDLDVTKNYFSNRVVDIWSCLPSYVVSAPSLNSFKHNIKSVDFSKFLTVEV